MSIGVFALVALGGGLGASLRFVVDGLIMRYVTRGFPWGIFVINASGSLLLGFLTGLADSSLLHSSWAFIVGGAVLGGYTTFSTAMVDTVRMLQRRNFGRAAWNGLGMIVVTVALALLGLLVGQSI